MLLLTLWNAIVYLIWIRGHLKLAQRGRPEIPNRYKAAVQLSRAIDRDFAGQDLGRLRNSDLEHRLHKTLGGGRVEIPSLPSRYGLRDRATRWAAREKAWLVTVCMYTVWAVGSWFFYPYTRTAWVTLWFQVWVWLSLVFAVAVGSTVGSRLFLVTAWALLGSVSLVPVLHSVKADIWRVHSDNLFSYY